MMVRRNSPRTASATLNYCSVQTNRLTKLGCQRCRATLEIYQPNVDQPDQFLATCPNCGAWYRVEARVGETHGVMISLPEARSIATGAEPIPNPNPTA